MKTKPRYFKAVADGRKPFEIRFNDRDYKIGDQLVLFNWPEEEQGHISCRVTTC